MVFRKNGGAMKTTAKNQMQKKKPFQKNVKQVESEDDEDPSDDDVELDSDEDAYNDAAMDSDNDDEEVKLKSSKLNLSAGSQKKQKLNKTPMLDPRLKKSAVKGILQKTPTPQRKGLVTPAKSFKRPGDDSEDDDEDDSDDDDDDDESPGDSGWNLNASSKQKTKLTAAANQKKTPQKLVQQKAPQTSSQKKPFATPAKTGVDSEDDDDEEEDEDDEEEDDDEEDDDDDVTTINSKSNSNAKQMNVITPKQSPQAQQKKNLSTPGSANKAQLKRKATEFEDPNAKKQKFCHLSPEQFAIEERRQKERDKRTLFVALLPPNVTEEDIRALSGDILDVRIPHHGPKKSNKRRFAFLEFKKEAKAEENYVKLQNKKIGGQKIAIDFVGEKSEKIKKTKTDFLQKKTINNLKLFVAGLPPDCDISDLTKLFPSAKEISLEPKQGPKKFAYIAFSDEVTAATIHKESENLELTGKRLTVLFAAAHQRKSKSKRKANKQQPQKKQVTKTKGEEVEEDDDDDDEDDDDDDDDDD